MVIPGVLKDLPPNFIAKLKYKQTVFKTNTKIYSIILLRIVYKNAIPIRELIKYQAWNQIVSLISGQFKLA